MADANIERLVSYLRFFGKPSFEDLVIQNGSSKYARIYLETTQEIANGLESFVNSRLDYRSGGYRARLKFSYGNNGFKGYIGEIVLDENLPVDKWRVETDRFLHSLPKVIKSFRQHNPTKGRKE